MTWNDLYSNAIKPTWEQIADFIDIPLWTEFNNWIKSAYQIEPNLQYSCCSMQTGWNIKYKKSSKSLCTLYPMSGYFIALVVVGSKDMLEVLKIIPICSDYTQNLFNNTSTFNGQRWLMIEVQNKDILKDVINLIKAKKPPTIIDTLQ